MSIDRNRILCTLAIAAGIITIQRVQQFRQATATPESVTSDNSDKPSSDHGGMYWSSRMMAKTLRHSHRMFTSFSYPKRTNRRSLHLANNILNQQWIPRELNQLLALLAL